MIRYIDGRRSYGPLPARGRQPWPTWWWAVSGGPEGYVYGYALTESGAAAAMRRAAPGVPLVAV